MLKGLQDLVEIVWSGKAGKGCLLMNILKEYMSFQAARGTYTLTYLAGKDLSSVIL